MQFKPITVIAALLLLVASLSACGCTSQQQTTQTVGNATEVITTNKEDLVTVNPVTLATTASPTPKPGFKFVGYNATVKNVGNKTRVIGYNDWTLRDTEGGVYRPEFSAGGLLGGREQFNGASSFEPGDITKGIVVFQVPQNATLKSLTFGYGDTKQVFTL